jgi:CBS domain-containing protein
MGDQQISPLTSQAKKEFLRHLLDDIQALECMIEEGLIESGCTRLGAEQEYCLVGDNLRPAMTGPQILEGLKEPHFTSELAQWNLEINLDPQEAGAGCFARMNEQLTRLLEVACRAAEQHDSHIILTGILPTIRKSDLDFANMTPNPRYRVLDNILKQLRGEDFIVSIEGVDEVSVKTDSILYEACNTSFQIHLQIDPAEFADRYNWAQVLAGPVLACSVNSPCLLGRELWMETRIALFRQSLDVRHPGIYLREKQPRVGFGHQWLKESVIEIFKDDVAMYRLLISSDIEESSMERLRRGEVPELRAMNLHNGTLYKWNRACYGVGQGKPHLRIENRYVPSGPSPCDEMANAVFWIGTMMAMPDDCRGVWHRHFHFRDVRHNFLIAAQHGLSSEFSWFGRDKSASALVIEDVLPLAREGLKKIGVPESEYDPWLQIIEERVRKKQTGADWIVKSMRRLQSRCSVDESLLILTREMHDHCRENIPVHQWPLARRRVLQSIPGRYERVDSVMSASVLTVRDDDLLDFARSLMEWYDYERLPVENLKGQLQGVITSRDIRKYVAAERNGEPALVGDCMTTRVLTVEPEQSLEEAETLMLENHIGSLPVVRDDRIIGIITVDDIRETRRKMEE